MAKQRWLVPCILAITLVSLPTPLLGQFLYVGDYFPAAVKGYSVNSSTGALMPVPGSPYPMAGIVTAITADPSGRFLYATRGNNCYYWSCDILAFRINPITGALAQVAGSPIPTNYSPVSIAIHPTGKFAYVGAAYGGGVSVYSIDPREGTLSLQGQIAAGNASFDVKIDPTGRFAYAADFDSSSLYGHTIEAGSGALTSAPGSPFVMSGTNPLSIGMHPSGNYLYAGSGSSNFRGQIIGYAIDPDSGALTPLSGSPFVAPGNDINSVVVDRTGKFVYVANSRPAVIAAYEVGVFGTLTPISETTVPEENIAKVALDCAGRFLYATVSANPAGVYTYEIQPLTGVLTKIPGSAFSEGSTGSPYSIAAACPTAPLDAMTLADTSRPFSNVSTVPGTETPWGLPSQRSRSGNKLGTGLHNNGVYVSSSGSWQYRKAITISHAQVSGAAALTSFPVLISLTDADLQSGAQASGKDILFTAGDGVTKLNHEIESYDSSTGKLVAWVQVPSLSPASDTALYLYYGNPAAADQSNMAGTWDSNYVLVAHFPDGSTLNTNDSTSNGNNGAAVAATAASGQIGGAANLSASSSEIDFGSTASLDNVNPITIEMWFDGTPGLNRLFISKNADMANWDWRDVNGAIRYIRKFSGTTGNWVETTNFPANAMTSLSMTYDDSTPSNNPSFYINGSSVAVSTSTKPAGTPSSDAGLHLILGQGTVLNTGQPGTYDELRISKIVRSPDWIKTGYNNQRNPGGFYTVAAQENIGVTQSLPIIGSFAANPANVVGGGVTTLSWSVSGSPAPTISIDNGIGAVSGNSTTTSVTTTTTYTLTVTNSQGSAVMQTTVTVSAPPPAIGSFTVNPASINAGQSTTLSWSVSGASSVSIDKGVGSVTGQVSTTVAPTATTTYTLTATNSSGSMTSTALVTVTSGQLPAPLIVPKGGSIGNGQTITLTDQVSTASIYYTLDGSTPTINSTLYTAPFSLPNTATVNALAVGSGLANSAVTSGTFTLVMPPAEPQIDSFTASPAAVVIGQSTTLSWSTWGAETISIDNGVGIVSGNSIGVVPGSNTVYTVTATNSVGNTITRQVPVIVNVPLPLISSFIASPAAIAPGQATTLSGTVSGATSVSISSGSVFVSGTASATVSPLATTIYTLTAIGPGGSASAQVAVPVTGIVSLLDQSYSSLSSARKYDLYYSSNVPNPQTNPIAVIIHGGGWCAGDKTDPEMVTTAPILAQNGFDVYSINYTLSVSGNSATLWPVQENDAKCFLSYLASGRGIGDPNRISIWGFSAGAHLSLMTGLTAKSQFTANCEWNSTNYTIRDVAGSSPPSDLLTMYTNSPNGQSAISGLLGYVPTTNPPGALAASPVNYVSANSPPVMVESGTADVLVIPPQTLELANDFSIIGVAIQRYLFNGLTHTLDLTNPNGQSVPPIVSFMNLFGK